MNTGNEFGKVTERMQDAAKSFGLSIPMMSLQRKVIATEAYQSEDDIMVQKIQKHMCHSAQTCEKFYQHSANQTAISTKRAIEKLTMARHFTPPESNIIIKEYPITEEKMPSLATCLKIKEKYNLQKTKKQIQDHWRAAKLKELFIKDIVQYLFTTTYI